MDHIAIDLGGRESQICIRRPNSDVKLEKRWPTASLGVFLKDLEPSRVIVETCAEAFKVARDAEAAGHEVRVVPATLVRALGVGRRGIKTDIRDARCLSEASVRMDLGSVHVPSPLAHDMRVVCTARHALVRSRTLLVNSVRGWMRTLLLSTGKGGTATFTERVREALKESKTELPPGIERQLAGIDSLTEQIKGCDQELEFIASRNEDCKRVMTVPGVGPATAVRFVASLDGVERFKSAHELESYFGLTPGEDSSSDTKRRTGLTKAGNATVRWLLVQAAWTAFRTRRSDPMVLWACAIAERKKNKFIAVVALARKIVGVMYALLRDKTKYQAQRASTVRADEKAPMIVASGTEVTARARPDPVPVASTSEVVVPPASTTEPRKPARARRAPPSSTGRSAGWGKMEDSSTVTGISTGAPARRRRKASAGD